MVLYLDTILEHLFILFLIALVVYVFLRFTFICGKIIWKKCGQKKFAAFIILYISGMVAEYALIGFNYDIGLLYILVGSRYDIGLLQEFFGIFAFILSLETPCNRRGFLKKRQNGFDFNET
jgi:hypothetical protein